MWLGSGEVPGIWLHLWVHNLTWAAGSGWSTVLQLLPPLTSDSSAWLSTGYGKELNLGHRITEQERNCCAWRPETCGTYPWGKVRQEIAVSLVLSVWHLRGSLSPRSSIRTPTDNSHHGNIDIRFWMLARVFHGWRFRVSNMDLIGYCGSSFQLLLLSLGPSDFHPQEH